MGRLSDAKKNLTAGINRTMKKNISIGKDRPAKINLTTERNRIMKENLSVGINQAMVKESMEIFLERVEDGPTAAGAGSIRRVISFRKILIKTEVMITSLKAADARAGSGLW
jgi:hypothetical protein